MPQRSVVILLYVVGDEFIIICLARHQILEDNSLVAESFFSDTDQKQLIMDQAPIQIGQFILGKNLGIGAFGKVGFLNCVAIFADPRR